MTDKKTSKIPIELIENFRQSISSIFLEQSIDANAEFEHLAKSFPTKEEQDDYVERAQKRFKFTTPSVSKLITQLSGKTG